MADDILEAFGPNAPDSQGSSERKPPLPPDTRVFVPAHPRHPADPSRRPEIGFELLGRQDGSRPVPVAFTDVRKLVAALGDAQPWIAVPVRWFVELMRDSGFGRTYLDPEVEPGTPTWSADAVKAYAEAVR